MSGALLFSLQVFSLSLGQVNINISEPKSKFNATAPTRIIVMPNHFGVVEPAYKLPATREGVAR